MKNILFLFLLAPLAVPLNAQFGITGRYHFHNTNEDFSAAAEDVLVENTILGDGYSIGIDYWFRLKNFRVEFLPELNYSRFEQSVPAEKLTLGATGYHFFFNTNFYLFDLKGDCDCPTFSKEGPTLEKGFFLQLSPGVSLFKNEIDLNEVVIETDQTVFSIGLAAGFDLGLSDLLTVSPQVGLRFFPASNWDGATTTYDGSPTLLLNEKDASVTQIFAGLRVGIRLDE